MGGPRPAPRNYVRGLKAHGATTTGLVDEHTGKILLSAARKRCGLSLCCERHQRVVSERLVPGYGAEEGGKGGVSITAAVEAVNKLVEIGLQMPAAQTMIDAQGPYFEVGEDAVHPGRGLAGIARAGGTRIVLDGGAIGMAALSAGLGGGIRREVDGEKGVQAGRGVVGHGAQPDAAEPKILNLEGAGDQKLAMLAAAVLDRAIVLAATGDFGAADLDQAG